MTPSTILKSLRAYVLEHGWTKGQLRRGDAVCAYGGLQVIAYGSTQSIEHTPLTDIPRFAQVINYLFKAEEEKRYCLRVPSSLITSPKHLRIAGYNDYCLQSIEDFIEWVDAAIALAEADEAPEPAPEAPELAVV